MSIIAEIFPWQTQDAFFRQILHNHQQHGMLHNAQMLGSKPAEEMGEVLAEMEAKRINPI